ncbi:MAG TPA: DUF3180 domain-containing protein [Mycobacteriales bacterium]|jgi:hypothetical protein|nr:DUF3180 domain-containing protein [Mycobacteriales bacterium]
MRPTRWPALVLTAVVAGGLVYLVMRGYYADTASPSRYASVWLALLAIAEGYFALVTRARLARRPGTQPINPLVVARFAALAKASSIVGALAAGGYAGFLGWVAPIDSPAARYDTTTASIGIGCGVVLVIAALLLERACRVPKPPDEGGATPPTSL